MIQQKQKAMKRLKPFYRENEETANDRQTFVREFSGRMTGRRYEILSNMADRLTYDEHCGCEHDCCGCQCGQHATFTYAHNQVSFYLTKHYNY